MVEPENRLFCRLDGGVPVAREQQRLKALTEMGLLEAETIPVFEAATQTAADFLEVPICILGFLDHNLLRVRSAVGLSRLGLMNQLAQERQLPRHESFCTHVVESHQVLAITDALSDPAFANSVLVQHYGIRAYLGVPLMEATGHCLGAIAVMDLQPRTFNFRDIKFLELMACWSMSEFERNRLLQDRNTSTAYETSPSGKRQAHAYNQQSFRQNDSPKRSVVDRNRRRQDSLHHSGATGHDELTHSLPLSPKTALTPSSSDSNSNPGATWSLTGDRPGERKLLPTKYAPDLLSTIQVKLELLAQLSQELRTPLTSVLGMASVVSREIYGPLTSKQKEYLEIIQRSGRYLLSLVNEISELGTLEGSTQALNLTSVDIEMLCQQALITLEEAANRREQEIRLTVEPGISRIWVLDKDKVRQMLYHLVFSVIQASTTGSVVHIHVSHKDDGLNLAISVSHPWLGDGLTQIDPYFSQLPVPVASNYPQAEPDNIHPQSADAPLLAVPAAQPLELSLSSSDNLASSPASSELAESNSFNRSRESLRLLLSCHLAELHGGQISIQGTPESGYRYVASLPELAAVEESL